jgi:pimeloyl-ACP methyl ester carboxylesterase
MGRWATGRCKSNGIEVHYLRTGGRKPPVLLLHGLLLNGSCWTPLARALEDEYDVVMPDARGHGRSSVPDRGYSYDNLADDAVGLVDALRLDAPVLIGHSMGGMTAAVAASRNPKRFRGLVLADPAFLTPERQREVETSDIAAQHRLILDRSKEEYLEELGIRRSRRSRELNELFATARFQTSLNAFEILTPPNPDYVELIRAITLPTLLVVGDTGPVVSREAAAELAELNPQLLVVEIAEAGHAVPYDQPERFAAIVKTYLRSVNAHPFSTWKGQ